MQEAIREAQEHFDDPPPNESTTCEWIIYPLLMASGYARRDIYSRVLDQNRQFPDYSILPSTEFTWFLEAKAWNEELEDRYAQQSLNYANQNGRRWVVLSNGKVWRLYDNRREGLASAKLVTESALENTGQILLFLEAIGKTSVLAGGLERFAEAEQQKQEEDGRRELLQKVMSEQLSDENSSIIQVVWRTLKRIEGLENLSRGEVFTSLNGAKKMPYVGEQLHKKPISKVILPERQLTTVKPHTTDASLIFSLEELRANTEAYVTGRKPQTLFLPDGISISIKSWVELASEIILWLGKQGKLPSLPFHGSVRGGSYFLNTSPRHQDREMITFISHDIGSKVVYIDTKRSGDYFIKSVCYTLAEVGISLQKIRIELQPTQSDHEMLET